jgi:CubicO group peptidase (beta-lactamase class C family)
MKRVKTFSLIGLLFLLSACLKEEPMKKSYEGFAPVDINDGWELSYPSAENVDSIALDEIYKDFYADDKTWLTKSLLVFRNGKLIAESYLKDNNDRTRQDAIWSCTKQVNGIITGIAIHHGFIGSVEDSIGKYLPEYIDNYPDKKGITIRHLLTMNSGLSFDNGNDNDKIRQRKVDSSTEYLLGLGLSNDPGTKFKYKDSDPQLISAIVQQATGKTLDEYGKEVLFDPLGITNYQWTRYIDGITLGSYGILTNPREMAKVAQCVLDSGQCNNQQVIPMEWLNQMLTPHVPNAHNDFAFGYLWWIDPGRELYFMWGHGGQHAFILPSKQLLIVITSFTQVDDDVALPVEYLLGYIDRIAAAAY